MEQSRWGLAPAHSLFPNQGLVLRLLELPGRVSSKWLRFPFHFWGGEGIFPKVPITPVSGEVKVGGLKGKSCLGATE